jgi:hypothetical protein
MDKSTINGHFQSLFVGLPEATGWKFTTVMGFVTLIVARWANVICQKLTQQFIKVPVVPHKAVAEVSKIGNL